MSYFIVNALPASVLLGACAPGVQSPDKTGHTPALPGQGYVALTTITAARAAAWVQEKSPTSAVGHSDTAAIFSEILGTEVPENRISIPPLGAGTEQILAGLYTGPRLPEGATTLPEGATITWVLVSPLDLGGWTNYVAGYA